MAKSKRHEQEQKHRHVRIQDIQPINRIQSKNSQSKENSHPTPDKPTPSAPDRPNSPFLTEILTGRLLVKMTLCILLCLIVRVLYTQTKQTNSTDTVSRIDRVVQSLEPVEENFILANSDQILSVGQENMLLPTVFVGILVRNKAHTLPYFLNGLEKQDYPTDRIHLAFYVDNSIDESSAVMTEWVETMKPRYHHITLEVDQEHKIDTPMWSVEHYEHVIKLRQRLLDSARQAWADFYLQIDADVVLINSQTIKHLVHTSQFGAHQFSNDLEPILPVLSPMLNCTSSEYYTNFWGAMNERGYYARSENYFDLLHRHITGVYPVAMVHTMFIVNLNHYKSSHLAYTPAPEGYDGPVDDLIRFARSAQKEHIQFYLDNSQFFGYLPAPVEPDDLHGPGSLIEQWIAREQELFVHLRMQAMLDQEDKVRVLPSEVLKLMAHAQLPTPSKLGFDEVYYINLVRRQDRRAKMDYFLDQLGIAAHHVPAMDGQQLNDELVQQMGIRQLKGYSDPYHKRPLKYGEIGCFLSHYSLWKEMIDRGYQKILVLEDDVRFAPGFVRNLADVLREADKHRPDWELIYIGRKRMSSKEKRVPGTKKLAYPDYTYWTLGYVLKHSGAVKLLGQDPLKKMIAVDEYLPIMFNRHPRQEWLEQFEPRNLVAMSAEPLLIEPQRYTGEMHYISDTEDSAVLPS